MKNLYRWLAIYNDGGTDSGNPPPAPTPPAKEVFTQEQVNAMLAKEKRTYQANLDKTTKQLADLQQNANLTKEERDNIAANLEALQNEKLTEKQIWEKEQKKLRDQLDLTQKTLGEEANVWKNQYSNTLIANSLTQAAVKGDALRNEQLIALLQPNSKVVPVLGEDGKVLPNQFKVVVSFIDYDAKGTPSTLELSPDEVVKRMREDTDRFGNLFKGTAIGGTGGTGGGVPLKAGKIDLSQLNHEQYVKLRKEGKIG